MKKIVKKIFCLECGSEMDDCSQGIFAAETFYRCCCGKLFLKSKYGDRYFLIKWGK